MWLENTMDPSHANWLHDGDVGKWEDSSPLNMRLVDNAIDANKVVMTLKEKKRKEKKRLRLSASI